MPEPDPIPKELANMNVMDFLQELDKQIDLNARYHLNTLEELQTLKSEILEFYNNYMWCVSDCYSGDDI
jgi:hypothetical protein